MSRKILLPAALGLFAVATFCLHVQPARAQTPASPKVKVSTATKFMRTQPLRDMRWSLPPAMQRAARYHNGPITKAWLQMLRQELIESGRLPAPGKIRNLSDSVPAAPSAGGHATQPVHDPVLQRSLAAAAGSADGFTQPIVSFDGLGASTDLDIQFVPPDANAAVGEKYVIEMVSAAFAIYNKKTGKLILGPVPNNSLWTGFGGPCENQNDGNPIVLYDQLAHRWILSQYAVSSTNDPYRCIAVSQTDDPTGSYYLYAFQTAPVNYGAVDPATMAVWPDAYELAGNMHNSASPLPLTFRTPVFAAFDRAAMLAGDPNAQMVSILGNHSNYGPPPLPVTLDGYTPPPAGTPGLFAEYILGGFFRPVQELALYQLHVDWSNPGSASLTGPTAIRVAPFPRGLCNPVRAITVCLVQPQTSQKLDPVGGRLMYRAAYRNLGDHQALVLNQTVSVNANNPPAGIRWYELDAPKGAVAPTAWKIAQQGTFAPADGGSRWLGSIAMDGAGNIALGYSLVGPNTAPSIAYTGRHAGDPTGKMTEPETILQSGVGVQTGTNLWGAFSSMAVAPDDCTFWYANEYYAARSLASWSTHLGAFRFPGCTPAPQGTLTGTVTDASSGQPIASAKVVLDGDIVAKTDAQGKYSIRLLAGKYTLATKIFGYASAGGSASVTAGTATEQDLQLSAAATATVSGKVSDGSGHGWPLYAEIKVFTPGFGQVADVWSDPQTGAWSVSLPQGSDYTLDATAYVDGYQPASATVTNLSRKTSQNFALKTDASCTAPGYFSFKFNQNFNGVTFPPKGWTVTNEVKGSPVDWRLNPEWVNPDDFVKDGNFTGGSGTAADINPQNAANSDGSLYSGDYDSSLVSPAFAVSSLSAHPVLQFLMNYQSYPATELDVDIRTDGGAWQNVAAFTTKNYGAYYSIPGTTQRYNLAPYITAGAQSVQLRWHFYYIEGTHYRRGLYGQIDDVRIGTCSLVSGGLVEGQVTDKNTGDGVVGATVSVAGFATKTFKNAADSSLPAGFYISFAPPGKQTLNGAAWGYHPPEGLVVQVAANSVNKQNISLGAGRIGSNPSSLDVHVTVGSQENKTLTLANDGNASAHYRLVEANRPSPPATGAGRAVMTSSPLPFATVASSVPFKTSLCSPGATSSCASGTPWATKKFAVSAAAGMPGTLVSTFFTYLPGTYSLGFDRDAENLWVGTISLNGGDNEDHQFRTDGTPTGAAIDVSGISAKGFEADMAYDDNTGTFWQVGISLTTGFCIYELNPVTMKATGRRICPDIPVYQEALAYDPTTNTWYSADFTTDSIYHFDASGKVLDFAYNTGEPIIGLTYDSGTGYLFATATGGTPDVGVWDTRHNYKLLGTFSIPGLHGLAGAGLSHDCAGHLWIASAYSNEVFEAQSGIGGWCDFRQIPWLSESPASGTVAAGSSAKVTLGFDGTGQAAFTTSHSRFLVRTDTPYHYLTVPVTVHWVPQPVDLDLTGNAVPSPVHKGNGLVYTLKVKNASAKGNGAATDTTLSYAIPAGVSYVSGSGAGVSCATSAGSFSAPAAASATGVVSCDLGTLAQGASKTVTIAVKANTPGTLTSTFKVSSREPDRDTSNNTLTLATSVLGTADLTATASGANVDRRASATLHFAVGNNGPDTATDVKLKLSAGSAATLSSATPSQGSCASAGANGFDCDLGAIAPGATVGVDIQVIGSTVGTSTLTGQVTTTATDPNADNNVAQAEVVVSGGGNSGGGGGFGGLGLGLLFALALTVVGMRNRRLRVVLAHTTNFVIPDAVQRRSGILSNLGKRAHSKGVRRSGKIPGSPFGSPGMTGRRMKRKLLIGIVTAISGALILLGAGLSLPLSARAAPASQAAFHQPMARVAMAPQSSLSLLSRAQEVGPHAEHSQISLVFGLKLRNEAKLNRFLSEVQDPRSPVYHHWLTPAEFTAEYGPTEVQVAALKKFLARWGIKVTKVASNRLLVHTRGSTAAYEHALEIRINDYELGGRSFYSTADSPRLPTTISPLVVNVLGLNHGLQMVPLSQLKGLMSNAAVTNAPPPASTGYFNPHQIAKAYDWPDITNSDNGEGVSIAIMTALTPNADNPNYHAFWKAYGLPDHTINVINVGGSSGTGGQGETALDVEWSGAMAPGADINVYVAADASLVTFAKAYNQIVTDNNSQVMTTSWGLAEPAAPALFKSDENIFKEAVAQGMSLFAASGDNAASDCAPAPGYCPPGPNNADYPSSSVYIAAANGTELTVSNTSGSYDNEHAWADTGGAISQLFDKPVWQAGPGVPTNIDKRMNSDLAMNAGPLHPYLVYLTGPSGTGYYGVYGTSAVAPQLAGLFADGISENGGVKLGQSNKLIYDDVNANKKNYGTDFHDVTSGCNGFLPDGKTKSCAGVAWDHPTGWGSPKAKSLLSHLGIQGPRGTITGTVTDSDGNSVAGAKVSASPGVRGGTTNEKGLYIFDLPVGSYTVTVSKFGFKTGTAAVKITDGATTTQDFQLQIAPRVTVSGHVKDGSGHGWGLYAAVEATTAGVGEVAHGWTDPTTGAYSINVPEGYTYTLSVTPYSDYSPASVTEKVTGDTTKNFVLITPACGAPGYHFTGIGEDFNGKLFPPEGWTKTRAGYPDNFFIKWYINEYSPSGVTHGGRWNDPNWTGGSGGAAEVNSAKEYEPYYKGFDASLISPPLAVTSLGADPQLTFRLNYQHKDTDALDVDLRADGGAWEQVAHLVKNYGGFHSLPGATYKVDLGHFIPPGAKAIQLRWRYHNETTDEGWYVQVDDVKIGACETLPGGLVMGQVTDENTGKALVGVTLSDGTGHNTKTFDNAADPNLPEGYYILFASAGQRTLTASSHQYQNSTKTVNVAANSVKREDFKLAAGRLASNPPVLDVHVTVDGNKNVPFNLHNTGSAPAHYQVVEANQPVPPVTGSAPPMAMSLFVPHHGRSGGPRRDREASSGPSFVASLCGHGACSPSTAPASTTATGPGSVVSEFTPGLKGVYGLGVNHDAGNLWVGSISLSGDGGDDRDHQFQFDGTATGKTIDVSSFSPGGFEADMAYDDNTGMLWQIGSEKPSEFCIHEINPATPSLTGRKICPDISPYQSALAYDPLTNTWYSGDFTTETIYHFDSTGRILDFKNVGLQVIGLTFNPATGHLFATISRPAAAVYDVYVMDPQDGYKVLSAFSIPGLNGGAGAGLGHDCAGHLWVTDFIANKVYEVNSGETGWCAFKQIPWLSEAPATGTVATGAQAAVNLSIDGTGRKPFTTTHTQLIVHGDTPYALLRLPVVVHWDPHPVDLVLTGNAAPDAVVKGNVVTYTLTVKNKQAKDYGSATETKLIYPLPAGANYVSASGNAVSCMAPPGGSSPAPAAASAPPSGTVICDFGTLAQGASKTVTIAVQATAEGTLTSAFSVSAREPDSDTSNNSLSLSTKVIGTADLALSTNNVSIKKGGTGTVHFEVANAGPDPATGVTMKIASGAGVELQSATAGQGNCKASGDAIECDLGAVAAGGSIGVDVTVSGVSLGDTTVTGQAATSANEPDTGNNLAQATVTVTAKSSGGGGALGWLALAALLGLAFAVGIERRRRNV